jgi:UDP-N-acetylmuramyl pentapeptide synthase
MHVAKISQEAKGTLPKYRRRRKARRQNIAGGERHVAKISQEAKGTLQSEIFKEKPAEIHRLQKGTKQKPVVAVKDHTRFQVLVDAGGSIWSGLPIICQRET